MTIKYVWREPFTPFAGVKGADAQVVGEAIQKIKNDNGGELRPRLIWQAAKAPRHPLHKFYPWDVQVAAESYWDHVSRKLAGSIRVLTDDDRPDDPSGPAFISISEKSGVSYRTIGEVLDSTELQAIALRQAERELEAFEKRYRMFTEICDAIRKARELVAKRRAKASKAEEKRASA